MGKTFRGFDRKDKLKFKEQRKNKHKRSLEFELRPKKKDNINERQEDNSW